MSLGTVRAWVHHGVRQTGYDRAGSGGTVVLLNDEPRHTPLFDALARNCRVIRPDLDAGSTDLAQWFGSFLDALGVPRVSLVAADTYVATSLRFMLAEPDRIERLALLGPSAANLTALDDVQDLFADRNDALLVQHGAETGTGFDVNALVAFLTTTSPASSPQ